MFARKGFHINGQVQGVGFRPCVYQVAVKLGLSGWVRNDVSGVTLEVQGESANDFLAALQTALPSLAKIDTIETYNCPINQQEQGFSILKSQPGKVSTIIPPDMAICALCLQELFNKKSRFYYYPFLNCTQCGPRLSITYQLPYDRCQTSMATFPFCAACEQDYHDPNNRRYHAQPTACAKCGPHLSEDNLVNIAKKIQTGELVAIKGLGGYQLICDANNIAAVEQLRQRKNRPEKPLAIMVLNLESIKMLAEFNEKEVLLLESPERPIILLKKNTQENECLSRRQRMPRQGQVRGNFGIMTDYVSPNLNTIGIMLPSTPLHYLLFHALLDFPEGEQWLKEKQDIILVVTSANEESSPILREDETIQEDLHAITDNIIAYNRSIVTRIDDSVIRVINQAPCYIRRARGYVPKAIKLAKTIPSTLALGGYLKNTFCITRNNEAFLSQHIGDLKNKANRDFFHETLEHFLKFLDVQPECVAHDTHPDFYTTQLANEYDLPTIAVQHHHAHLAAVAAEYQLQEPALGLALDGLGYGLDNTVWGGELFLLDNEKAERLAHLHALSLPAGDKTPREPWIMGASVLHALGHSEKITQKFPKQKNIEWINAMLDNNINTIKSSSCGRLFDAAAALLGVHVNTQYEGQAAMKLESLVTSPQVMKNGWIINDHELSFLPLLNELLTLDSVTGANVFHGTLIAGVADLISHWSAIKNIKTILLSGGCFLNKILTEGLINYLKTANLTPLFPKQAPPNDGGLALGQVWIGGLSCV